jgi:hypothetical protein
VAETNPNGGLGVVSATPLAPWGWPSHPLVPKGMAVATPSFFFFFFSFFKKIYICFSNFFLNKKN